MKNAYVSLHPDFSVVSDVDDSDCNIIWNDTFVIKNTAPLKITKQNSMSQNNVNGNIYIHIDWICYFSHNYSIWVTIKYYWNFVHTYVLKWESDECLCFLHLDFSFVSDCMIQTAVEYENDTFVIINNIVPLKTTKQNFMWQNNVNGNIYLHVYGICYFFLLI